MAELPFTSLLFVCTGNICRSPTAEGVMRHMLRDAGLADRVRVDSCGTTGWHIGDGPSRLAVEKAAARGYDLADLRARQLAPEDFREFDLILGMDEGHLRHLKAAAPADARARIALFLEADPRAGRPDVPDPYYGGEADYEYSLDLIERGCRAWLSQLTEATR